MTKTETTKEPQAEETATVAKLEKAIWGAERAMQKAKMLPDEVSLSIKQTLSEETSVLAIALKNEMTSVIQQQTKDHLDEVFTQEIHGVKQDVKDLIHTLNEQVKSLNEVLDKHWSRVLLYSFLWIFFAAIGSALGSSMFWFFYKRFFL